ncbi:unnamed protein product [Parascedosporium putredinis]|uniref:phosphogluconate dehydrogenase (NADP(+)-dependent, decarboxylating) n=1 Tax=Parascedosporium putredinis TaxID=1442378 RepID=A0A9P1M7B7_9PEZI|nr:unnamed protein product [Parascedosporium putredinis]CAI7990162.1 unnamed protein product [Parascedosporium putredinis]
MDIKQASFRLGRKGDLIKDGSNEKWTETERRQREVEPTGTHYIGMGVSGGYQAARRAPSLSPGGTKEALDLAFPFLQKIAAKGSKGNVCVAKTGPGGSGHYDKMVHNGIKQGMMTPLNLETGHHVLSNVRDKVVQDADNSEGTGAWACEEVVRLHVPGPTILSSHLLRLASADATKRKMILQAFGSRVGNPSMIETDKSAFLRDLRDAVYASFLASFIQGLHTLARADEEYGWGIEFRAVLQVWRAGCIIRCNALVDLLDGVYANDDAGRCDKAKLLSHPVLGAEIQRAYPGIQASRGPCDRSGPEADLDYFGEHMFDLKTEAPGAEEGVASFLVASGAGIRQDG